MASTLDTDTLVFIFCAVMVGSAILLGIAFPQKTTSASWDDSRPASQKAVADVVKYKSPSAAGPSAKPLVILLVVVLAFVIAFGGKTPGF